MILATVFTALLFLYSLVSARLERSVLTAPMLFTAAGMGVFLVLSEAPAWRGDRAFFLHVAEAGLVLLLFTDASRTDLKVLNDIRTALARRTLVISIAAGVSTARIRERLGTEARLLRVMPNTPALVLEGVTAIAKSQGLEAGDLETADELFRAVGKVVVLDEELMDAVTGLSGSGPAYVAIVIESLADGGVKMGLDRPTAMTLASQTVLGAARLLMQTGLHPGALKDMVSSPGGTTIAGIAALEEGGIRTTFIKAVERATLRSRELGRGPA